MQSPLILTVLSPPLSLHARAPRPAPRPGPTPQPGLAWPAPPDWHGPASPGAASWRDADTRSGPASPLLSVSEAARGPLRCGLHGPGLGPPGTHLAPPGTARTDGPLRKVFPAAPRRKSRRPRNVSRTEPRPHRSPVPGHRRAAPPGGGVARGSARARRAGREFYRIYQSTARVCLPCVL